MIKRQLRSEDFGSYRLVKNELSQNRRNTLKGDYM